MNHKIIKNIKISRHVYHTCLINNKKCPILKIRHRNFKRKHSSMKMFEVQFDHSRLPKTTNNFATDNFNAWAKLLLDLLN
jgi:hypothetical protein